MAVIQNGWQHDNWIKMATKGPLHSQYPDFSKVPFNQILHGLNDNLHKIIFLPYVE